MCGRYDLNITAMELAARFQAQVLKASTEVTPKSSRLDGSQDIILHRGSTILWL